MLYGRDRDRFNQKQVETLRHPIRLRILELWAEQPGRSLTAADLAGDLSAEFEEISVSQTAYHLRQLQRAELLPVQPPA